MLTLAQSDFGQTMAEFLFKEDMFIPVLAIACGTIIALVSIIWGTTRSMVVQKERERTKRELAAYVAEGTMSADKAIALMESDRPAWETTAHMNRRAAARAGRAVDAA